jgi:hypothetical protein
VVVADQDQIILEAEVTAEAVAEVTAEAVAEVTAEIVEMIEEVKEETVAIAKIAMADAVDGKITKI